MLKDRLFAKIGFYLLSMVFFILIVAVLGTDIPICLGENCKFIGWENCLTLGILVPIVCGLLLLYVFIFIQWIEHQKKGTHVIRITVRELENVSSETMSFVASYFIPLVSFNISSTWRHAVVLCGLFVLIGFIYIKSDVYYCNPTLNILGYNIYRVKGVASDKSNFNKVVILKDCLSIDDKFDYIQIDNNTCFGFKK